MPLARKKSSSTGKRNAPSAPKKQASKDKTIPSKNPSKTKSEKRTTEVKRSPVAKPPNPPRDAAAKMVAAKPKVVAKKSKSLDKPKSAAKPQAPTTKSAGRQHPKAAAAPSTHLKTPSKVNTKSGQKGAIAGDTNAGLVIAYGSAHRAKSLGTGGLLTARHHRSSGSPAGEPITPPYGDVRTMVCDVSPVPSDVESIDFSNSSKPPPDRKGLFGRSQQTLRVGHHDKKLHTAKGMRHSESHHLEAQKSDKVETPEEEEPVSATSDDEKTAVKNEIAVRIVPDSARQKITTSSRVESQKQTSDLTTNPSMSGVGTKESTPVAATSNPKANGKESTKLRKINVTTTGAPQASASKGPNPKAPPANGKSVKSAKPAKIEKLQLTRKPKTTTVDKQAKVAGEGPNGEARDTVEGHRSSEHNGAELSSINTKDPNNQQEKDKVMENSEMTPTVYIKADEECCKAFAILNSKGIRVSLRTLRRALLTPTEYRLLQSTGQITDN